MTSIVLGGEILQKVILWKVNHVKEAPYDVEHEK